MKMCAACGQETAGQRFCTRCGSPLTPEVAELPAPSPDKAANVLPVHRHGSRPRRSPFVLVVLAALVAIGAGGYVAMTKLNDSAATAGAPSPATPEVEATETEALQTTPSQSSPVATTSPASDLPRSDAADVNVISAGFASFPKVAPKSWQVSGNSTFSLTDLHWSTWDESAATGTGVARVNDCDPSCAEGGVGEGAVDIVLTDPLRICGLTMYGRWEFAWQNGHPFGDASKKSVWQWERGDKDPKALTPWCD